MPGYKSIVIPDPCTQNWELMRAEKQGRFCTHCSKTVTDFTGFTDKQIADYLQHHTGELCGRFDKHQLNRALLAPRKLAKRNKLHEIFAALLLLFAVSEVNADTAPAKPHSVVKPDSKPIKAIPDNADTTTATTITGRVIDSKTNLPVAYTFIENQNRQITTSAGKAGRFEIAASIGDTINISFPGYKPMQIVVVDLNFKNYLLVVLKPEIIMPVMGKVMRVND